MWKLYGRFATAWRSSRRSIDPGDFHDHNVTGVRESSLFTSRF